MRTKNGELNLRKFLNTLDYSLDLIKLREIHKKVYRRNNFSFKVNGDNKEYSQYVINVTFNYSNKLFNRVRKGLYIKFGYSIDDVELKDCAYVRDGELIAIQTYEPLGKRDGEQKKREWEDYCSVITPLSQDILGKYFYYDNGFYKSKSNIKTLTSIADIRTQLYENGFMCDGVRFVRWKRSAGSGRVGKCLFIDARIYKQVHKWEMCGIKIRKGQKIDLASLESYISLTLSSIIDTIEIFPNNILVIDDFKSVFKERVMATKLMNGNLVTEIEDAEIENNIWDGQSLLDTSMFGEYNNFGMLLLRSRFFKSCCFNTNIQKWFNDNNITNISQLNGFTLANSISDIKLITTPSSIKYLKFGSLDNWLRTLEPLLGIVKHEKSTKFFDGRLVQCHYQLLNTIQLTYEEVGELIAPSLDYLLKLKTIPAVLRQHVKYQEQDIFETEPLISKNDIIYKFLGLNEMFSKTKLYNQFCTDIIKAFIKNLRKGHLLINGNYSTLFGNPIEMLKQSIGQFDGNSSLSKGTIHSYNFDDGETILGSRSPHVAIANTLLAKNAINPYIREYFNLTNMIVCINSIGENILEQLSGCDFDSDSLILTNHKLLIHGVKRNYYNFDVPTKLVKPVLNERIYSAVGQSDLDIKTSVNKIGEIINLSQELNSKLWDLLNNGASLQSVSNIYRDAAQLDVMSNLEIDSAKKENPSNNVIELKKIKERYKNRDTLGRYIRPIFFKYLDKDKGFYDSKHKVYKYHKTTMDFLQKHINRFKITKTSTERFCKFTDLLKPYSEIKGRVNHKQINEIIELVRTAKSEVGNIYCNNSLSKQEKYFLSLTVRQNCSNSLKKYTLGEKTMYRLLSLIENPEYSDISKLLFNTFFATPNETFYRLIKMSKEPIGKLDECANGDIKLYDFRYELSNT